MKFGMFFLAEYVNLWIASLLITVLFLGGYLLPWPGLLPSSWFGLGGVLLTLLQVGS